ncbi:class I SAM-dependent methyltransferase [Streptantibioticus silvisoli]|uniref:Class I SAM-dependent methyltransferase n=1 Tax=Streptantibioticus silvisoli TaxID=2705255 RepID=A0ABT6W1E6_9ACTN|nr:class I SAM-dependent methyltransferase [Streptantibioticus silvisoli]MDI5964099.1 class I SAM-dependent methyltransferase [Streptantibioticus silvisoli]
MKRSDNPFLSPSLEQLYGGADRLAARTSALGRAKVSGPPVPLTIARLAVAHSAADVPLSRVADIGCGRGTSSRVLTEQLAPRRLVAVDASRAMIAAARRRVGVTPGTVTDFIQADFHNLPLRAGTYDLVSAAFCLYHSPRPAEVVAEFARILARRGVAILVTKSADSYRELDHLVAAAGLDQDAPRRGSLYAAAHSGNIATVTAGPLDVLLVEHEEHRFRFTDLVHVALYLATNPKYRFPPDLKGDPEAIAQALRRGRPDTPVTATSIVTYVVARPRGGHR